MPSQDLERAMRAVLAAAAERAGFQADGAILLHLHSNAIFALPRLGLLVRIATNPDALPNVTAAVRVTHWLAGRGYPCVVPADVANQPFVVNGRVVTFWHHLPLTSEPPTTAAADLGRLLRDLHGQPLPPLPPPPLDDPLASVSVAVSRSVDAMSGASRDWLTTRIGELRDQWRTMAFPHPTCLIHGDAHDNNLMRTTNGTVVLGDWDHVAIGPREWDLVQLHYTRRRFHRPTSNDLDLFTEAYGWDIRDWPGLDTLIAIREISGLAPYIRTAADRPFAAKELAHRVATLQQGQSKAVWTPPPRR